MNEWQIVIITMILQGLATVLAIAKFSNSIKKDKRSSDVNHEAEHATLRNFMNEVNRRVEILENNQKAMQQELYSSVRELFNSIDEKVSKMREAIDNLYQTILKIGV